MTLFLCSLYNVCSSRGFSLMSAKSLWKFAFVRKLIEWNWQFIINCSPPFDVLQYICIKENFAFTTFWQLKINFWVYSSSRKDLIKLLISKFSFSSFSSSHFSNIYSHKIILQRKWNKAKLKGTMRGRDCEQKMYN